jgi:hypothetical protein
MFGKTFGTPNVVEFSSVNNSQEYFESVIKGDFLSTSRFNPGTQKAKGIFFLQNKGKNIKSHFYQWNVPKHILFKAGTTFNDSSFNFPVFARPCPLNPRHGFVDSTICLNSEELNKVSALTLQAEADAEILVTKPVDAAYNAIINGGVITFAAGNDGATAGKGVNYFYISSDPLSDLLELSEKKVIAENEMPFYELVFEKDVYTPVHLVQVRSAPKTPRVKDFVPAPVVVKNILKAEGDLLEWESLLKTVDPDTTIIDHTDGSLSSHYAIHAIVNNIPIFTTYLPPVGSTVQPTVENTEINEVDVMDFRKAFAVGFDCGNSIISNSEYQGHSINSLMGSVIRLGLATLHNYSSFSFSKDYGAFGMIVGLFCRAAFAISMGESRYNRKRINEKYNGTLFAKYYSEMNVSGRSDCYKYMYDLSSVEAQKAIYTVYHIFDRMKWDSSYGGKKWAACTKGAVELFNASISGDIKKVVELLNVVINENHNGGRYLNKVVGQHEFDEAAMNSSTFALKNIHNIVDILHHAWQYYRTNDAINILNKLNNINLEWSANSEAVKLNNFYIPVTSSKKVNKIEWKGSEKLQVIDLFNPVDSPFTGCACTACLPEGKLPLFSIPFWIVDENGQKVISKASLNKILSQMGFESVEIK